MTTVIAGAGEAGRRLAGKLVASGQSVLLIEDEDEAVMLAREEGFEVLRGDVRDVGVLKRAGVGEALAFVIALANDDRALLAAQQAKGALGCKRVVACVENAANFSVFEAAGVLVVNRNEAVAAELAGVLAGAPNVDALAAPEEGLEAVRITVTNPQAQTTLERSPELRGSIVVLIRRSGRGFLPTGKTLLELGDQLTVFGPAAAVSRARSQLTLEGRRDDE